jgi:hypothetical protein
MRYGWIGLVEYNGRGCLTINAPLILKMRDIIFFAGKLHNGPFHGIFRGGQAARGAILGGTVNVHVY